MSNGQQKGALKRFSPLRSKAEATVKIISPSPPTTFTTKGDDIYSHDTDIPPEDLWKHEEQDLQSTLEFDLLYMAVEDPDLVSNLSIHADGASGCHCYNGWL